MAFYVPANPESIKTWPCGPHYTQLIQAKVSYRRVKQHATIPKGTMGSCCLPLVDGDGKCATMVLDRNSWEFYEWCIFLGNHLCLIIKKIWHRLLWDTYRNLLAFCPDLEPYIADQHVQDCHSCNKTDDNHSKLQIFLDKYWNNLSEKRDTNTSIMWQQVLLRNQSILFFLSSHQADKIPFTNGITTLYS